MFNCTFHLLIVVLSEVCRSTVAVEPHPQTDCLRLSYVPSSAAPKAALQMIKVSSPGGAAVDPPRAKDEPREAEAEAAGCGSLRVQASPLSPRLPLSPRELFASLFVLVPESPSDTIGESGLRPTRPLTPPPEALSRDLGASALLSKRAKGWRAKTPRTTESEKEQKIRALSPSLEDARAEGGGRMEPRPLSSLPLTFDAWWYKKEEEELMRTVLLAGT